MNRTVNEHEYVAGEIRMIDQERLCAICGEPDWVHP